jgi:diguanylate cyclase (GGDEF)-like protein
MSVTAVMAENERMTVPTPPGSGVLRLLLVARDEEAARTIEARLTERTSRPVDLTWCRAHDDPAARLLLPDADGVLVHVPADQGVAPAAIAALRAADVSVPIVAVVDADDAAAALGLGRVGADDVVLTSVLSGELVIRLVRHALDRRLTGGELRRLALHDALTGLPNRALFEDRLQHAVARLPRSGRRVAVVLLDVRGFTLVNESLGYRAGDELLVQIAERLGSVLRPTDSLARLSGDEFAILCDEMDTAADPGPIARRILSALVPPFTLDGVEHRIGAVAGVAAGEAGSPPEQLLRDADVAVAVAKARGAEIVVYEAGMRAVASERLSLQHELHLALEREELVLHYQPQVHMGGGAPIGVEALVRWQHPERGLVGPGEFIQEAEDSGIIVPLGRWVLRAACRQLARWQAAGGNLAALTMSVNLSARQLAQPELVDDVAQILVEEGVDPERICLEITETAVLEDAELAARRLHALKRLGVKLAIDDFGTGYSSLAYLNRFPVDTLKIDRSFIQGMDDAGGARRRGIVAAVIKLADAMGLEPLAEGVEVEAQAEQLQALGCRSAQGFLYSAAREAHDLEALVQAVPPQARATRVLVCDDAPGVRDLMRTLLQRDGDVVVCGEAADGESAIRAAAETSPDVVLLDLGMPHLDGLSALPRICAAAPGAKVVVLSGRDAAANEAEALALGAARYLQKPAGIEAVRDVVRDLAA